MSESFGTRTDTLATAIVSRREVWGAGLLLLLLMAAIHYDVLFLGRSLITTNFFNPLDYRLLPQNYGADFVQHDEWTRRNLLTYAGIRDPAATWWQWEPSTQFLKQAIKTGEWPFWDPYIAAGTPAMANLVPAFFFPPYAIVVALGASVPLLNAYFLFLLWGASFLTFLFIRRHGLSFIPAAISAIAVMLSGAMLQHQGTFIGQTASCLPLILYATRWFLDLPNQTRAALLAIVYAIAALASFPPLLVVMFGITALYALIGLTEHPSAARSRALAWWCGALLLSLGLVSFYYLPALAARAATPQLLDSYRGAAFATMPVVHFYQLLSPTLMGGVPTYLTPPLTTPSIDYIPYVGIVAVALASLANSGQSRKCRTLLVTASLSLLGILLKLFGAPVVQWIGGLPVLSEIHIAAYFGIPVGYLVACLAALGAQAVLNGSTSATRGLIVALAIVTLTESLWRIAALRGVFKSPAAEYWIRDWGVLATVTVVAATTILVAALSRHRPTLQKWAATILLALVAAEGIYNGWYPNPAAWSIFDSPVPFVRSLQENGPPDRMFSFGAPNANLNSAFGIYSMDSLMAFNPPRMHALYHRYSQPPAEVFMRQATRIPPEPVLDRANIAVLGINKAFVDIEREAQARGYSRLFDDGFIVVFRRPTLPRFFFTSAYRVVSHAAALEAIAYPPSREVVLEREPGFAPAPDLPADPQVHVEAYRRNSVSLIVDAPRPGLVYAAESFFDGWTALVNGASAQIFPANCAFRAVAVPPGRARVEFRYWPPGLTVGLTLSIVSMMLLAALLAWKTNG
jgi:hypothetical protein